MKEFIIGKSINLIKNSNDFNDTKLEEIKYGLEAVYITFTKMVVVLFLAIILNTFKETIVLLMLYNLLRLTGFGLHASKSWMCWISSILIFIGLPIVAIKVIIPKIILIAIGIIAVILYFIYAPSDTKNRPLVNKTKRQIYKYITVITGFIYLIFIVLVQDSMIQNLLCFSMIIEMLLILPITYKFFDLPYRNYLNYV